MDKWASRETALQYLETLLRYVAAGSDQVQKNDLEQAIRLALDVPEGEIMLTLAERWIEEGREQGLEQGLEEAILQAMDVRFGPPPAGLVEMVQAVDAPPTLRELLRAALTVDTLDDFRRELEKRTR